jgi:hypothetical protein
LGAIADYDVDGVAGRLYIAEFGSLPALSAVEIAEAIVTDQLPDHLTYPHITPALVQAAREWRTARLSAHIRRAPAGNPDRC